MTDAANPVVTPPAADAVVTPPAAAVTPPATTGTLLTSPPATTEGDATKPPADAAAAEAAAKAKADADAAEKAKAEGAPEKYEAFNFGEGVDAPKPEHIEGFSKLARELNLSQAKAQRLVDYQAGLVAEMQAQQQETHAAVLKGWRDASTADKEFGGAKIQENAAIANKALRQFGSPELIEYLKSTGLGDHPELIRAFWRVGQAISEDGHIQGGATSAKRDDRELFYGASMAPKS